MTKDSVKEPQPFHKIFAAQELMDRNNETVYRLLNHPDMQIELIKKLKDISETRFINLVTEPMQARIAMGLYSGDGVVLKITPEDYMSPYGQLPGVVPSFWREKIDLGGPAGSFVLENLPFVQTRGMHQSHVNEMKKILETYGLMFKDKDDKPDNVGLLLNGKIAVIDGDAVRPIDGRVTNEMRDEAQKWVSEISALYPSLYSGYKHCQSPDTDFTIRPPHKPEIAEEVSEPVPETSKQPETQQSWLKRTSASITSHIHLR